MFENILGNELMKTYLQRSLVKKKLPHALLFAGLDGIGKSLFAKALAVHLLNSTQERICSENHPDFHVMRPEGKSGMHAIETVRQSMNEVYSAPFESFSKCFLIHAAERMQPAAANACLKTLEEPTSDTFFILLTSALGEILPTIRSRCFVLHFNPLSEEDLASLLAAWGFPTHFAKQAHGSAGKAYELAARKGMDEEALFFSLSEGEGYAKRACLIERIESQVANEDPLAEHRNVDNLFSSILMWYRDQIALQCALEKKHLFFPHAPIAKRPLPTLSTVIKIVEEARLAYARNLRLSVCLEKIFSV